MREGGREKAKGTGCLLEQVHASSRAKGVFCMCTFDFLF